MLKRTEFHSAHQHSSNHRKQILASEKCACFYCGEDFPPSLIDEWIDEDENEIGQTALCPIYGIDSVLGDNSGLELSKEFLSGMHEVWFNT